MTPDSIERYARHLVLKEIGGPGQQALLGARVAIVGAGGLGGPVGLYLAAAGVGHITLIDDDRVEASNLQRQVQFVQSDIGQPKATLMADTLDELNPDIMAKGLNTRLTDINAKQLLDGHDVIIDGVDHFPTRYAINAAARALKTPLVSGALGRWHAQVGVFSSDGVGPCYRCLVPEIPPDAPTCAEVGVIGALAGVTGSMMAMETIKLITGAGEPLRGHVWIYDGLSARTRKVKLTKDPGCPECGTE